MTANALPVDNSEKRARVVGHVDLAQDTGSPAAAIPENDFLTNQAAAPWSGEQMKRDSDRTLAEIKELQAENRWDDIIALFHYPNFNRLGRLVRGEISNIAQNKKTFSLVP